MEHQHTGHSSPGMQEMHHQHTEHASQVAGTQHDHAAMDHAGHDHHAYPFV